MGVKPPDWRYLESLSPDSLEEEELDKVFNIGYTTYLLVLYSINIYQVFSQLQNWEPDEGDDQLRLAFSLVQVIAKYNIWINETKLFSFSWCHRHLKYVYTPALSHNQDFKKGTNKRLMYYWPPCHTDTGNYCQNLKRLGKKCFLVLFSLEKYIFSALRYSFCLVSLGYYHRCISEEILTYFDPQHLLVVPK